jgi:hypothetical protein
MTGLDRYTEKERRKQRRHNHIARDLMTPKYRQRRINNKKRDTIYDDEEE